MGTSRYSARPKKTSFIYLKCIAFLWEIRFFATCLYIELIDPLKVLHLFLEPQHSSSRIIKINKKKKVDNRILCCQ